MEQQQIYVCWKADFRVKEQLEAIIELQRFYVAMIYSSHYWSLCLSLHAGACVTGSPDCRIKV